MPRLLEQPQNVNSSKWIRAYRILKYCRWFLVLKSASNFMLVIGRTCSLLLFNMQSTEYLPPWEQNITMNEWCILKFGNILLVLLSEYTLHNSILYWITMHNMKKICPHYLVNIVWFSCYEQHRSGKPEWNTITQQHYTRPCMSSSFVFTIAIMYLVITLLSYLSEWSFSVLHGFVFLCLFLCMRVHHSSDVSCGVLKFFPLFLDMLIQFQDFRCHI